MMSDFGTANQAIEWLLDVNIDGQEREFLNAWAYGELDEWPEYLEWLGRQLQHEGA